MTTQSTVQRRKGPQKPSRYPIAVGPRYKIWGEQPGFIYNPYQDQYLPDVEGQTAALQASGVLPKDPEAPKDPSLFATLLPIGGAALLNTGGQELGKDLFSKGGSGLFGNLLGGGSSTSGIGPFANPETYATALETGTAPATGLFTSSFGSGPTGLLGIGKGGYGGPALGALGAYDLLTHKYGAGRGALQGAASGAAIGSYFSPVGTAIGAGVGGLIGLGKGLMNRGYSDLEEQKRKQAAGMGYNFQGGNAWENNPDFAKSRDESKLKGEDLLGAADWVLKYGDRWGMTDRARQIEIANEAIKRGLVREHNGGIDINTGGLSDFVKAA